jgi:hypothetical protein
MGNPAVSAILVWSATNRVIFKRLNIEIELPETIPRGL